MTDKEKFKRLLQEFGIGFTESLITEGFIIVCRVDNDKVVGYGGFFTEFRFDSRGKFIEIGIFE